MIPGEVESLVSLPKKDLDFWVVAVSPHKGKTEWALPTEQNRDG